MVPAACPNCSGSIADSTGCRWIFGRPTLIISRRTKRISIVGCCMFSGQSRRSYETEEAACQGWATYRAAKAARDPYLKSMMERLDRLEQRLKPGDTARAA